MSKDQVTRVFKAIRELVERLHPDEDLEMQDVRGNLEAAGFDTTKLRERLHAAADELARAQRKAGKIPPQYLKRVVEATAPTDNVPTDPGKAIDKMKGWISSFQSPVEPSTEFQVARSYRKSGDLSKADHDRLDELERRLKERAQRLHEPRQLPGQAMVDAGHLALDDPHFLVEAREVDPQIKTAPAEGIGELAHAVRREDDVRRMRRLDRADLGDRHLPLGEDLEHERFQLFIGAIDFVDEEHGRPEIGRAHV